MNSGSLLIALMVGASGLVACKVRRTTVSEAKQIVVSEKKMVIYLDEIDPGKNFDTGKDRGKEEWRAEIFLSEFGKDKEPILIKKVGPYRTKDFDQGKTFITVSESEILALLRDDETPYQLSIHWFEKDDFPNHDDAAGRYTVYLGSKNEKAIASVKGPLSEKNNKALIGSPFVQVTKGPYETDISMTVHWVDEELAVEEIATRRKTAVPQKR